MRRTAWRSLPIFLSTPSARRATSGTGLWRSCCHISIHALREEGDLVLCAIGVSSENISIHALREEGDAKTSVSGTKILHFYPRPPRGGRLPHRKCSPLTLRFLSTPSARRATNDDATVNYTDNISIHALREEGDRAAPAGSWPAIAFLSTPSARRATDAPLLLQYGVGISIHALREEGDTEKA